MTKIIVVGNNPNLRDRIERAKQRPHQGDAIQVEILEWGNISTLARKRPAAVVLDVRSPDAATIEAISRLRSKLHQPPLMLQVTPRQLRDSSWGRLFPGSEAVLFTRDTSKKEVQSRLPGLLKRARARALPSPPTQSVEPSWPEQNDRRIALIFKERDRGLAEEEQAELAQLQEIANRQANQTLRLPFDALAELEQATQRIVGHG